MNPWIIFGVLTLIIGEILFIKFADEKDWISAKLGFLGVGALVTIFFWVIPYSYAFDCGAIYSNSCTNYGIEFFYWYYGTIIAIIALFWFNKKLIQWKTKKVKLRKGAK